jgi:hypothetical protein
LSDRRDDLVAEPTPTLSRLHVLLADLQPGGANRELTATRAAALLRQIHPITAVDVERKRIARQLLADVRRLDRQVKTASQAIRQAVRSPAAITSPATAAPPRSRPPAAMCAAIA